MHTSLCIWTNMISSPHCSSYLCTSVSSPLADVYIYHFISLYMCKVGCNTRIMIMSDGVTFAYSLHIPGNGPRHRSGKALNTFKLQFFLCWPQIYSSFSPQAVKLLSSSSALHHQQLFSLTRLFIHKSVKFFCFYVARMTNRYSIIKSHITQRKFT